MEKNIQKQSSRYGQLTLGAIPTNTLVELTAAFVQNELSRWRDRPDRRAETSEEILNAQLCKHLNAQARHTFPMVQFHHEEKQTGDRRVDLSAGLTDGGLIGTTYHSIDDPFIVLEGKRLPAPGRDRAREYVRGTTKKSGGIQRFKLGLHGAMCEVAVMIGYIQKDTPSEWRDRINVWICEFAGDSPVDGETWETTEQLTGFFENTTAHTATLNSVHCREGDCTSASIRLHHFWVKMNTRAT